MSGKTSRSRGKAGEREARNALTDRDYDVLDTCDGLAVADIIAERYGVRYAVEVKHCRLIDTERFWRQAKEQAKRHHARPMLMCRISRYPGSFLVLRDDEPPTVWNP